MKTKKVRKLFTAATSNANWSIDTKAIHAKERNWLTVESRAALGIGENMIRHCVGIESIKDIKDDIQSSLKTVSHIDFYITHVKLSPNVQIPSC